MKKALKISLISIGSLLALILILALVLPALFKPQILKFAQDQARNFVRAEVHFDDLTVSLFRGFPDLYLALDGVHVVNEEPFAGDTLVRFDRFAVKVNLMSLFDPSRIEVHEILLSRPVILARIDTAGRANWDIFPGGESAPDTLTVEEDAGEPMALGVALERLVIEHGDLQLVDDSSRMYARAEDLNFTLTGDLALDRSKINLDLLIARLFFGTGGVTYAPGLRTAFHAGVDADLERMHFVLEENTLDLNALGLEFDGWLSMPGDSVTMDLTLGMRQADFKTLLSLVPAVFLEGFESLRADGQLELGGHIRGTMVGDQLPSAEIALRVRDAMFQYEMLPGRAEGIHIDLLARYDGAQPDASVVDLNRLAVTLAGNPVQAEAHIHSPMSDPEVRAQVAGHVDLGSLKDIVPLDSMRLGGALDIDLKLMARQSWVEALNFEKCKLDGDLRLQQVVAEGVMDQPVQVQNLHLGFNPAVVDLKSLQAQVGKSDVQIQGGLRNFLPFLMTEGILQGNLALRSQLLDLNDLFPGINADTPDEEPASVQEAPDTSAMDLSLLRRVNFDFDAHLKRVNFQKLVLDDVVGRIAVAGGQLQLNEIACKALDGSARIGGAFDFRDSLRPHADLAVRFEDVDVAQSVRAFSSLEEMIPTIKYMQGRVGIDLEACTDLSPSLSPHLETLTAKGSLRSSKIAVAGSPTFTKIGRAFNDDAWAKPSLKGIKMPFMIHDGTIELNPFDLDIKGIKSNVSGAIKLDQTMDMAIEVKVPRAVLGKAGNALQGVMSKISPNASMEEAIPVTIRAEGAILDPKISFDVTSGARDQIKSLVGTAVEEVKAEVKGKVDAAVAQALAAAEREADRLRQEADRLAERTMETARQEAAKVREKAAGKNFIARKAADEAANLIMKKAEEAAEKIRREADTQATNLINKAKQAAKTK